MSKTLRQLASLTIALTALLSGGFSSGQGSAASLSAQASQPAASPEVIIYHAGSLTAAFDGMEDAFAKATGIRVNHRGMGSVEAARRVTIGKEPCDIYASADYMTIDAFLKPAYADFNLLFAQGGVVLTYTTDSRNAASIADPGGPAFAPPASVPNAVANWHTYLTQPGVKIGGSDPSADPGGYRALMAMQLAQYFYGMPTLYQDLFRNHMITGSADRLGVTYDYQFSYEHSARASAVKDPRFRFVRLPPEIDLSSPAKAAYYGQAVVSIAGLASTDPLYAMRGTRVVFGLTVLKNAPNREAAIRFLQFMLSTKPGEGVALQAASGPDPLAPNGPAWVSLDDYGKLPGSLTPLVRVRP
jgi:molybdate/tungstate transport system substrate-binding protein